PRDMMYDGNVQDEPGAVVCRVSPSFVRFGSFEILTSRRDTENLKKLADHVIKEHYSHLGEPSKETYLAFFREVVDRTKTMIVHWQRVGFVHGVMNTDNMSILGLTIDYGPYGWLENYDPNWTPNTTDAQHRRYRYGNQPNIAMWNLMQLANALYPLIEETEGLETILQGFKKEYLSESLDMMLSKIGLTRKINIDAQLIDELKELLENSSVDMTIFFRNLSQFEDSNSFIETIRAASYLEDDKFNAFIDSWSSWLSDYSDRLKVDEKSREERIASMNKVNPKYVLRNYMAQLAIEAAEKGDYELIDELYQLLLRPYDEQTEMEKWFAKRPDWALNKVGCSMLSCSS
ncbi:MAG: protein adenylyltransferase SelO family protein, partial [Crocinitomicaceae bacterium]